MEEKKQETKKPVKKEDNKIKELNAKIAELTDLLKRVQADFENYKKNVEKEKSGYAFYIKQDIIKKILPILDSIELALKNTTNKEKFMKGVELIFAQLYSTLEAEGLKPIDALGKKFDPYKHEVLLKQESDKDDDVILEELQKGYTLSDKVIRHTKVKISQKKDDKQKNNIKKST